MISHELSMALVLISPGYESAGYKEPFEKNLKSKVRTVGGLYQIQIARYDLLITGIYGLRWE